MLNSFTDGGEILKMYDLLGVIGSRYKYSINDF